MDQATRKPVGDHALTNAEYQARHRQARQQKVARCAARLALVEAALVRIFEARTMRDVRRIMAEIGTKDPV
jgi:hypothetical protein